VRSSPHESRRVRPSSVSRWTRYARRPPSRTIHVASTDHCLVVRPCSRGALWPAPIRCRLLGYLRCVCLPGICARGPYRGSQRAQRSPPVTHRFAPETQRRPSANCSCESRFGQECDRTRAARRHWCPRAASSGSTRETCGGAGRRTRKNSSLRRAATRLRVVQPSVVSRWRGLTKTLTCCLAQHSLEDRSLTS
jgi:hypothetical protein